MFPNNNDVKASPFKQAQIAWIVFLGFAPLVVVCSAFGQTGSYNWMQATSLYPGVKYAHYDAVAPNDPRTNQINCLRIDTTTPNLRFYTTPRYSPYVEDSQETKRQTTRNFVKTSQTTDRKVAVAVNANAFDMGENPTDLLGLAVSEGTQVSPGAGQSSFVVSKLGIPSIVSATDAGFNINNVQTAVSGWYGSVGLCLSNGTTYGYSGDALNPRTGIGVLPGQAVCVFPDDRWTSDRKQRGICERGGRVPRVLRFLRWDQRGRRWIDDDGVVEPRQERFGQERIAQRAV